MKLSISIYNMSLESDVLKYGAKGATLDYIRSNAPDVPIEPFVLVPVREDWKKYESQIKDLGDSLVRSSSPLEDGQEMSFAGLFWTTDFNGQYSIDQVLESLSDEDILRYAELHGVKTPIEMGLTFQRDSKSSWNWGMLRHPHQENLLFIMGRPVPDRYQISKNFVFDEKTSRLQDVINFCQSKVYSHRDAKFEDMPVGIEEAIEHYRRIESLPAFQNGFSYHMEFGTDPVTVYQFRPFRKKQQASWNIDFSELEKLEDDYNISKFGISFGITNPKGLDLTLARALSSHENKKHIERYRKNLVGKPYKRIVTALLKGWRLSKLERAYAEEVARIEPDTYGGNESQAFDNALGIINSQMKKEETCLYQESMHIYHGRDIDLVFPNAKAWIASVGFKFLSHNWFRALQTYDVALVDYGHPSGRTGDKIKILSDGNFGVAIEPYK
jgi:hypothetical protein